MVQEHTDGGKTSSRKQYFLIFLCWLMYVSAYLGRYSYSSNITNIMHAFGADHTQAGLATTYFFATYGVGQVVNGILCKRYPKKYLLAGALIVSSALNLAVFFGAGFESYQYLWLINGAAQSFLWTSLIQVLGETLDSAKLRTAILVMSTTVAAGTLLSYGASGLFSLFDGWKWSFMLGATVMTAVAFLWFFSFDRLTVRENAACERQSEAQNAEEKISKAGLWITIALLALFAVIGSLIKDGLMTWMPSILKETFSFSDSVSILLTLVLPVIGFFGALLVSVLKKKTDNFVGISGVLYLIATVGMAGVLWALTGMSLFLLFPCFLLVYCVMSGMNNVVTSMAPLYLRRYVSSGVLAGVLDAFCYLGSTVSSFGLGRIADLQGWHSVFVLLLVCAGIAAVIAAVYLLVTKPRRKIKK